MPISPMSRRSSRPSSHRPTHSPSTRRWPKWGEVCSRPLGLALGQMAYSNTLLYAAPAAAFMLYGLLLRAWPTYAFSWGDHL